MNTQQQTSKRSLARVPTRAGVTCRLFTSIGGMAGSDGELLNVCNNGSYMVTSSAFNPGDVLLVRMVRYPNHWSVQSGEIGLRSIFLAEVKWREKIEDEASYRYGLGLKYLD